MSGAFASFGAGAYSSQETDFQYKRETGVSDSPVYKDAGSTKGVASKGVAVMGELGGETSIWPVNLGIKLEFLHHIPIGKGTAFTTGDMTALRIGVNL